jgi:diadenosine tetraphosphate (Ap4A) HIT family hydrolase
MRYGLHGDCRHRILQAFRLPVLEREPMSHTDVPPRPCPLCGAAAGSSGERARLAVTDHVAAFEDVFPSALGHTLVVPKRHVGKLADLTAEESAGLWAVAMTLLSAAQAAEPDVDFTVGVNDGPLAGQTIGHVHLHIIPRRLGDVPDPKGGIRWVIPSTAPYWESVKH